MKQVLIMIAIDYKEEDEFSIAHEIAAIHGGDAMTIKDAANVVAGRFNVIENAHVPHWSCSTQQNWVTQQEEISRLYAAMDSHICGCCHQTTAVPVGATDFEPGTCPPLHNCPLCADQII